jgi:hypothetical protein
LARGLPASVFRDWFDTASHEIWAEAACPHINNNTHRRLLNDAGYRSVGGYTYTHCPRRSPYCEQEGSAPYLPGYLWVPWDPPDRQTFPKARVRGERRSPAQCLNRASLCLLRRKASILGPRTRRRGPTIRRRFLPPLRRDRIHTISDLCWAATHANTTPQTPNP